MQRKMTCIVCPIGCQMDVQLDGERVLCVTGNTCKRGCEYALAECTNPVRTITSTVKVTGGALPVLPVKTDKPVPKRLVFDCIKEMNKCNLHAPVAIGDIIIENLLDTGINVVATSYCPALPLQD